MFPSGMTCRQAHCLFTFAYLHTVHAFTFKSEALYQDYFGAFFYNTKGKLVKGDQTGKLTIL